MRKITRLDAIDLVPALPPRLTQWGVGFIMSGAALGLRAAVDMAFPHAAPFALNYPFVLMAVFCGRLRAGFVALLMTTLYSWYYFVPVRGSFQFLDVGDIPLVIVSFITGLILVALAE